MKSIRLPRIQPGDDLYGYLDRLALVLEQAMNTTPAGRHYVVANPVTQRALDVTAGTITDVKNVVGTLIADLQAKGSIP